MINKETIDRIFDAARIEEVVGDFVSLKKRGQNLLGNCPFHNEKTPSFTVSPVKGIYKCFGCGKAGNSVNFIMEHEHLQYPEALRYIARKYNIEIEEKQLSAEEIATQNERESIFLVTAFAQKYFTDILHQSEEGQSIALSYFRERGFDDATVQKFQLGYSPEKRTAFTDAAIEAGYKTDHMVRAGLTIKNEREENPGEIKYFDRFAGRVMFPVHNQSGRVIAFGGRTLRNDKKTAKYINSPETEIYHKSNVLYGMYFAKKSIMDNDNCFLVEGYTDVISLAQAGIENVVASSGTSLTVEQIKQIHRYTQNITILYDGDSAGIKASFRGIDLILEEDMNVKVLLFPDGEDPDSFSKKVNGIELKEFIAKHTQDFVSFKTALLLDETQNDPIKKADLIRNIVQTIAIIPDGIKRSVYLKECSRLLDVAENVLLNELNAIRRSKINKQNRPESSIDEQSGDVLNNTEIAPKQLDEDSGLHQEGEIIRLLLNYGEHLLHFDVLNDETNTKEVLSHSVAYTICHSVTQNGMAFSHPVYQKIFDAFAAQHQEMIFPPLTNFINNEDQEIQKVSVDMVSSPYELARWEEKHQIVVTREDSVLRAAVLTSIYALKNIHIMRLIKENQEKLQGDLDDEQMNSLLTEQKNLHAAKQVISAELGRVILR